LLVAALLCHFCFYYLPGRFGQRTGLPLYVVGSSTFGSVGGFLLPGFLMGLLQFGWLAVNTYFSAELLHKTFGGGDIGRYTIMVVWAVAGVVTALKGIQYVARFATYLPIVPIVVLVWLIAKTAGGLGSFDAADVGTASLLSGAKAPSVGSMVILFAVLAYVVGFFATAGAAGVDFGTNSRDKKDVAMGGLVGVSLAIFLTIGAAILIVAGFYGTPDGKAMIAAGTATLDPLKLMPIILGNETLANWVMFALALTAFPSVCFCSLIAANSIKTTLPKINPWVSCGVGCAAALALAISGIAGKCEPVFGFIGASFGPICGAISMEYILCKGRWSGPRAGFNPAGWVSWAVGFAVGVQPNFAAYCGGFAVPAAPVAAFIVGAVVYALLAKAQSPVLPYPQADEQSAD